MARKPTYEELEQRVKELEKESLEHKRTKESLRKSELRFQTLFENAPIGIGVAALDGKILSFNHSAIQITGYSATELEKLNLKDTYLNPDDRSLFMKEFRKEGFVRDQDVLLKRKDGTPYYASLNIIPLACEGKDCLLTVFTDITERKRAEEALLESEEKYRSLFEHANDAIFIADTETNLILDANKQAEQLIGRPREEIIGIHQSELHPLHQAEYYKEKFREHVQKGRVFDLEAEVIRKDGSIVPVFISASVISIHGKQVIQGLFRDITEEKMILDLKEEIADRKLIYRAKGILMDRYNIPEKEARKRLQKESRRQSKKIREIAKAVISSESILD